MNEIIIKLEEKNRRLKIGIIIAIVLLIIPILYLLLLMEFFTTRRVCATKKPIIYLYPTEETNVTVKLGNEKLLTSTYPKYEDSWMVTAYPNGNLKDLKTGRSLYSLYWEGKNNSISTTDEGFIVKGSDTISFLEEKLKTLGLNERESEEFIIYWLPKMEHNKYNYIRFASINEINKNMPLYVDPNPDTIIRVLMVFKPLNKEIKVKEQKLTTPERRGFTLVEWGGTEIK